MLDWPPKDLVGVISPASLMPLLCPGDPLEYTLELVDVTVLVRLGWKTLEAAEYAEETVEAFED